MGFGRGRVWGCGMGWDGRKGVGQWGRVGMVYMGCVMIDGVFGGGSLACLWFSIFGGNDHHVLERILPWKCD